MLYNVPSRTGTCMLPSTIARLSKIDNIVAVKEAAGSVQQVADILSLCDLTVMSGDDSLTLLFMTLGATGVVSVAANIVPDKVHTLTDSFLSGNIEAAKNMHFEIMELCASMFIETNPLPVKTALSLMGKIDLGFRLPLCEMEKANQAKLEEVLKKYKLI